MNIERLVAMANDIAAFFAAEGNSDAAADQMASHLRRYWDPRMRRQIAAHVAGGGVGLSELARTAVSRLGVDVTSTR